MVVPEEVSPESDEETQNPGEAVSLLFGTSGTRNKVNEANSSSLLHPFYLPSQ